MSRVATNQGSGGLRAMDSGEGGFIGGVGRCFQMFPTMVKRYEGDVACGWKEERSSTPREWVVATCHRGGVIAHDYVRSRCDGLIRECSKAISRTSIFLLE